MSGPPCEFSQACQDAFVILMTKRKRNGTFVEIGSCDPKIDNNTNILYKHFNWKGLMVEYNKEFEEMYKKERPDCICIIDDARNIDYRKVLDDNKFPEVIDYLQIDLDVENRSTLDVLEIFYKSVFDKYKFGIITFEHDIYRGDFYNTREKSRDIMKSSGYRLLFSDVSVLCEGKFCTFEDWYIHPDIIDYKGHGANDIYCQDVIKICSN